jgi:hypothetical protein
VDEEDRPPGALPKAVVIITLLLLVVAGLRSTEAWPLTGWRLFSGIRTDHQTGWSFETVDPSGAAAPLSLSSLPLGYQLATWRLSGMPPGPSARGSAFCVALLPPVLDRRPSITELRISRDHERLVRRHGDWVTLHDRTVVLRCPTVGHA